VWYDQIYLEKTQRYKQYSFSDCFFSDMHDTDQLFTIQFKLLAPRRQKKSELRAPVNVCTDCVT